MATRSPTTAVPFPESSGGWGFAPGLLPVAATLAVAVDVATTAVILWSPEYVDLNLLVTELAGYGAPAAIGALLLIDACLLLPCWFRDDWLSTAAGVFVLLAPGLGGFNNVVLFLTGVSLVTLLGGTVAVHFLLPAAGVAIAMATAAHVHDRIPPAGYVAVGAVFACSLLTMLPLL